MELTGISRKAMEMLPQLISLGFSQLYVCPIFIPFWASPKLAILSLTELAASYYRIDTGFSTKSDEGLVPEQINIIMDINQHNDGGF
jgi:hypothetical protein